MINPLLVVLIITMTFIGAFAGFFLKKASSINSITKLLTNKYIYLGGILYLFSALLNIIALKYLNYSLILPLTSITYIWTLFISYILLKERITLKKIIGTAFIVLGAIVIVI